MKPSDWIPLAIAAALFVAMTCLVEVRFGGEAAGKFICIGAVALFVIWRVWNYVMGMIFGVRTQFPAAKPKSEQPRP